MQNALKLGCMEMGNKETEKGEMQEMKRVEKIQIKNKSIYF